jgi:tetratricopeptide (TPR) repeat protein
MKRLILSVAGVGLAGAVAMGVLRRNSTPAIPTQPAAEAAPAPEAETISPENPVPPSPKPARRNADTTQARAVAVANVAATDEQAQIRQSVDQLVSSQTSFEAKYHNWIKLRDAGKMDQVIAELNERATNNPAGAEYPAALGQAYLHKIAVTKDTRDYAVLGALADRSFDSALDIDPEHWEARFFKATAMSYWPEEMNKRPEVIQRFTQLIQDQETKSPQPQFAQSYYWLGESYQKTGRSDYADQVWRRGAALFPNDPMLRQKLAGP